QHLIVRATLADVRRYRVVHEPTITGPVEEGKEVLDVPRQPHDLSARKVVDCQSVTLPRGGHKEQFVTVRRPAPARANQRVMHATGIGDFLWLRARMRHYEDSGPNQWRVLVTPGVLVGNGNAVDECKCTTVAGSKLRLGDTLRVEQIVHRDGCCCKGGAGHHRHDGEGQQNASRYARKPSEIATHEVHL